MTQMQMKTPLDFIDPGAADDEPAKGVTNGHLRQWHDAMSYVSVYYKCGTCGEPLSRCCMQCHKMGES